MGARHQAQKRRKHQQGQEKGSPWSQKKSSSSLQVPDLHPSLRHRALLSGWQDYSDSSSPPHRNGFSMSQEARQTEKHTLGWSSTRLRDNAVSFVSAGLLHRDELDAPESKELKEASNATPQEQVNADSTSISSEEIQSELVQLIAQNDTENTLPPPTQEDEQIVLPTTRLRLSSISSASSASSSDEVVFAGRSQTSNGTGRESKTTTILPEDRPQHMNAAVNSTIELQTSQKPDEPSVRLPSSSLKVKPTSSHRRSVNPRLRARHQRSRQANVTDEEEALMRDYIENMAMDDDENESAEPDKDNADASRKPARRNETYRFYDGSGEEHAKVQMKSTRKYQRPKPEILQALDWSSGDLEEFDSVDTTDDEIAAVDQVLRRRERASGVQYLVTASGQSATGAKWVLHSRLTTPSAREEIRIFEEIQMMDIEEHSGDEVTSSSEEDEALNDLLDEIESEDDENEKIFRHTAQMTDEQIARALAKQEMLGMGGDELLLFDGNVGEELDDEGDDFVREVDFVSFSTKKHTSNRTRSKRNQRQSDQFPSAELFADVLDQDPYGGFDVMDFDRPSLRSRRKGRKSNPLLEFELEDDELAHQLYATWEKDREKKTTRKREKQEFHQALLLESAERGDPTVIKAEVRQFLISESDTLKLAPMESNIRAAVHRLAKALKLNSRSEGKEGKGVGRFPVLTKTAHTPGYTIDTVWQIDALLNTKKFFPKHSSSSLRGTTAKTNRNRGGGGVYSGATVRNGEVVGGSAPEISADNKGRAMLEKMGWTSGMGIGAIGNKGSVEVIKHVVKTTKAGLG